MQRINLLDEIQITLTDNGLITVECGSSSVPDGEDNIAWKAARAMLDLSGGGYGAEISIIKNIPVAAGLGGGSSDAAAVLDGMNRLLELRLPDQRLMEIGVKLGADVPFFIFKKAALAEGIGERLQALPQMPKVWLLLVNPGLHVSTAWVYKNLALTNRREPTKIPALFSGVHDICAVLSNDLESVTIPAFPLISEIKRRMLANGASAAMMSGSGPTVFGIFERDSEARRAAEAVTAGTDWFSAVAETL